MAALAGAVKPGATGNIAASCPEGLPALPADPLDSGGVALPGTVFALPVLGFEELSTAGAGYQPGFASGLLWLRFACQPGFAYPGRLLPGNGRLPPRRVLHLPVGEELLFMRP